ncbi:MAG: methyl-accepting chemotaxis protein [Desulfobulbaceae bacterium]|nr:methyl-accepting chemotaxis protein [Desulfobulbaceae bacterium]
MTIKTKLTLNLAIVLVIIMAVSATSIIGMSFVRNKLSYLTERSTPFQMRTVELQLALEAASATLTKVGAATSMQEYQIARSATDKALADVVKAEEALAALSPKERKASIAAEMKDHAAELFEIMSVKIHAEEEAAISNQTISQKIQASAKSLKDLDTSIKALLLNRQGSYTTSMESARSITATLRNIEALKSTVKDLQYAVSELFRVQDTKGQIIAKGKVNSYLQKALQNPYLSQNVKFAEDIKALKIKLDDYLAARQKISPAEPKPASLEESSKAIGEQIAVIILSVDQEVSAAGDKYSTENAQQEAVYKQSILASNVLMSNSELVSLGLTVGELCTRLFTNIKMTDFDDISLRLKEAFSRVDQERRLLDKQLRQLNADNELKKLTSVEAALASVNGMLFPADGVLAKVKNRIAMQEKAAAATEAAREIVAKQSELGRSTVGNAKGEQEKAITEVNSVVKANTRLIIVISILAIAVGIIFGIWVYRSIANPLGKLIELSNRIAQGDLRGPASAAKAGNDEVGQVQAAMAKMTGNLKEIAGKITSATGSLASNSEELSATATSLESGTNAQATQVEQAAAAMTEISQSILDVAKNAAGTADTAQSMKDTAFKSKHKVDAALVDLQQFADQVVATAEKINGLGTRSNEISGIIDLIRQIADQTNLLALNAAIEAARAGSRGRGFAVVAGEVRKLAVKSAEATNDITETIAAMGSEISASVELMRQERESAGKILEEVRSTLAAIDEIVAAVEQVSDMTNRIAEATQQQSESAEEVSSGMETIANIAKELQSSVHEIKATSQGLASHASELNSMAAWFKMK